jgi:peptidoglycan hydrolase CwlO-like protein
MKKHLFSRMIVGGVIIVMLSSGAPAFAAGTESPQGASPAAANLTADQMKQMDTERNAFQTATQDIRQQMNEKRQALQTELNKPQPDASTCTSLQKQISELQAQFDQKRITHIIQMKKIDPNFTEGRGFGMGMGMGPGKGPGPFGAGQKN